MVRTLSLIVFCTERGKEGEKVGKRDETEKGRKEEGSERERIRDFDSLLIESAKTKQLQST